jgi:hypothetical protein
MFNDCSKVVESYLLYQNPLYAFSLPISFIIAIMVYGICVSMKCTSNSYMLQIIIPILTIIIINVIIEFLAHIMLNKNEIHNLTKTCIQYLEKAEHFENKPTPENNKNNKEENKNKVNVQMPTYVESIRSPLKVTDNLYNSTYEVINRDSKPYTLPFNGFNTANNCPIA